MKKFFLIIILIISVAFGIAATEYASISYPNSLGKWSGHCELEKSSQFGLGTFTDTGYCGFPLRAKEYTYYFGTPGNSKYLSTNYLYYGLDIIFWGTIAFIVFFALFALITKVKNRR